MLFSKYSIEGNDMECGCGRSTTDNVSDGMHCLKKSIRKNQKNIKLKSAIEELKCLSTRCLSHYPLWSPSYNSS